MKPEQIQRRIAAIVIEELSIEGLTPETFDASMDLIDELGIDSMDLATIALIIRDEFGVLIDEDDYADLATLEKITAYVHERMAP